MLNNQDPLEIAQWLQQKRWVDLSHTLEAGIPAVQRHARFGHVLYGSHELGHAACHYQLVMSEHTGTHIDAPLHFIPEGPAHYGIDQVPLDRVIGRAATIQATDLSPAESLTAARVRAWEDKFGPLKQRDIVLIRYGWDRFWATGVAGREFLEAWPGLSVDAANYMVEKGVSLVGCDAISIDASSAEKQPAHYALLGNEVYIMENLNNLDQLPSFSVFMAFPLKVREGSGSPVRAVAMIDSQM